MPHIGLGTMHVNLNQLPPVLTVDYLAEIYHCSIRRKTADGYTTKED
jgi:hypothetical protein